MDQQRSKEDQSQTATDAVAQLRSELNAAQQQITNLIKILEQQQSALRAQQASIARLDRILMELLTGRTWRTLQAAGKLIKKVIPGRNSSSVVRKNTYLVCDDPRPADRKLLSGKITIRGWCLAEDDVESVQVEISDLPVMETVPNLPRADIKKAFPELDKTGRSGFLVSFDSLKLPNGTYPFAIRAISGGQVLHEIKSFIEIDHERGFSSDYDRWMSEFEMPANELIELKLPSIRSKPKISIVMPVYDPEPEDLKAAIQSVVNQSYKNWELCLADDCSSRPEIKRILNGWSERDSRIKVVFRSERGGISANSNSALDLITGDYVGFLDHDDLLSRNALVYICDALDRRPETDFFYSDEDKIDQDGKRFEPFFKPDWSPDLLLSENYISHFLVLKRDLLEKVGKFASECDGSQDYDLVLRASAKASRIEHIPHVLYHWRTASGSTAVSVENKQYTIEAARLALERAGGSGKSPARVEPGIVPGRWRMRYPIPEGTRVSIIIASGGNADVLRANLDSLFDKTEYPDFEVVVIDNSKQSVIEKLVTGFNNQSGNLRYIDWRNKLFNYSEINNAAARQCDSPVLLFLNDDTSVITPGWLEAMVELVMRPEVGAVGAKLLYPNEAIQHAGVIMGLYDNCGHAFKGLDGRIPHYFDFSDVIRNVSAVTGACLMTKASVFWEVGGFDEKTFAVAFNDIDLSLKVGNKGYRVLYTPHAVLYHHEAFSKTSKDLVPHPAEVAAMRKKWSRTIAADPYYSLNLTRNDEDYSLRTR